MAKAVESSIFVVPALQGRAKRMTVDEIFRLDVRAFVG